MADERAKKGAAGDGSVPMHPDASLSLVIPVHDEAGSTCELPAEIEQAMGGLASWERLWVDDGSTDESRRILEEIARNDGRHPLLCCHEKRGQSAALLCGLRASRDEFVGTLDADGQNDPRDLLRLLAVVVSEDVDLGAGRRGSREDSHGRRASSTIANRLRSWITHDGVSDVGCSPRIVRWSFLEDLPEFNGVHRFIPTLVKQRGGRIRELVVNHRPRVHGSSKYGVRNRLWRGIVDTFGVTWLGARGVDVRPSRRHKVPSEASSGRPSASIDRTDCTDRTVRH